MFVPRNKKMVWTKMKDKKENRKIKSILFSFIRGAKFFVSYMLSKIKKKYNGKKKNEIKRKIKSIWLPFIKDTKLYTLYVLSKYGRLSVVVSKKISPIKVTVINFNATNLCNSACMMCNVWKNKERDEISTEYLYKLLQDSFFNNVKHIGITGGEPTLRKDLSAIFETVINALPAIQGLSLITNCIQNEIVIERVNEIRKVCKKYNISFSMMVSLDGMGSIHDEARGKKNNFQAVINVLNYYIKQRVNVAFGCTISKINVWGVDELLDFAKKNNYYGRFRIAEFINRLHNSDRHDVIRNFNEEERYHLILFFYKLIFSYEKSEIYRRTYYSIISILNGGKRLTGCPYHSNGIMLDYNGDIAYCAPKSQIIGNAVKNSALQLYQSNIDERDKVLKNYCDNCIHDYHAPLTEKESQLYAKRNFWKEYINLDNHISFSFHKNIKAHGSEKKQILITGWYGTETVGDKAILGGIEYELREKYGEDIEIVITSLYPIITEHTVKELNINAKIIDVYSEDFVSYAKGSDLVMIGGGPLMDLDELALPLIAFKLAKSENHKTIIYGSGLGPLTKPKFIKATGEILKLADEIQLRDEKSVKIAKEWTNGKKEISCSGDPAKKYLELLKFENIERENVLRCYLRDWTYGYAQNLSKKEFLTLKAQFEISLSNFIKQKTSELDVDKIVFESMHNFVIGNDDRDFARYFIKKYFFDFSVPVVYNKKLSTVDSIATSMKQSVHNVVMRFHSVLFADTLQTSYTAIDYTLGGKIENYLTDNNRLENLMKITDLIERFNK